MGAPQTLNLPWKLTLGEKSLVTLENWTRVSTASGFSVWHAASWISVVLEVNCCWLSRQCYSQETHPACGAQPAGDGCPADVPHPHEGESSLQLQGSCPRHRRPRPLLLPPAIHDGSSALSDGTGLCVFLSAPSFSAVSHSISSHSHFVFSDHSLHFVYSHRSLHFVLSDHSLRLVLSDYSLHLVLSWSFSPPWFLKRSLHLILSDHSLHLILSYHSLHLILCDHSLHLVLSDHSHHLVLSVSQWVISGCTWGQSPWHKCTGWLVIKHQVTYYLLGASHPDISVLVDWA